MRLIDADALVKAIYHLSFETDGDAIWQSRCWVQYGAIERVINEEPTADAVKVVRCIDCQHFESTDPYEGWCHTWSDMTVDDGYCSYGERKDGEQND